MDSPWSHVQALKLMEDQTAAASEYVEAQQQESAQELQTFDEQLAVHRSQRAAGQHRHAQQHSVDPPCTSCAGGLQR